jgi:hypothetical protein
MSRAAGVAIVFLVVASACTRPPPVQLSIEDPHPYFMQLEEGIRWEYWKLATWNPPETGEALDTLICEVSQSYPSPENPVLLDGLLASSEDADVRRAGPGGLLMVQPHYLPPRGVDSVATADALLVTVREPVYQIAVHAASSQGKYPNFVANSSAGLIDLTSWILRRGQMAVPTYVRGDRHADLLVPTPGSTVGGWSGGGGGWAVTARDTLITVPAGRFSCIEITYQSTVGWEPPGSPFAYREYWTEGVGLVAWVDLRRVGDGIWVLGRYLRGGG